ncbi:MAG: VWA domain-containing protein [Verrucomicrobia bacterium]|nr:VWA domain-containing protein [Verrucomicrobiota bacterium]MDA1068155.1 VWA domain-containing protein [Verrucomicrobiota bacterium]
MLEFQYPYFLYLILAAIILPFLRGGLRRRGSIRFSNTQLAGNLASTSKSTSGRWLGFLRALALTLLIVALARPRLGHGETELEASGIDIVLAVDISGSMRAEDFKILGKYYNRLEVVKKVIKEFVDKRESDRIALIAFAGEPYLVSPLTLNHDWLNKNLERLEIGLISEEGTAIGSALIMSANRLRDLQAKSKVVILLTDGVNNSGSIQPVTAAEAAAALKVKVYTIAAGTKGKARVPVQDYLGRTRYQNIETDVDEPTLKEIAKITKGTFFRATDTEELEAIYAQIDELEKTEIKLKNFTFYDELFIWPLLLGLFFLLLEYLLASTSLKTLP